MGKIVDISSGGIRFISSEVLDTGKTVDISIDWPVLLDGACAMQLKGRGRIVRSDGLGTAVEIERYEFRTRKAQAAPLRAALLEADIRSLESTGQSPF